MGTPVLFIHGLWLHAESWDPWLTRFREVGYEPQAPGWPGDHATVEATRNDPSGIGDHGIDDVVAHFAKIIEEPEPVPAPQFPPANRWCVPTGVETQSRLHSVQRAMRFSRRRLPQGRRDGRFAMDPECA